MRVFIYKGMQSLIKQSGVGRAIEHQEAALKKVGVTLVDRLDDADIIHLNTIFPDSILMAMRAKKMGKKVIFYGHSTMEDFKESFIGSNRFAPLFKKWISFAYERGQVIITPTPYSKTLLENYGLKKPIYALSNGIDLEFWTKPSPSLSLRERFDLREGKKIVLSVGLMIQRKGILDYIELARRMPDVEFLWFGQTNLYLLPSHIRQAIRQAPSNLHFPGYLNKEALRAAYQAADAFCFMSHEETEGIVVLEALATGIPVIVRDIPVYQGWLEDGKSAYKCQQLEDFEAKLRLTLTSPQRQLQEEGFQVAQSRSLRLIGEQLKTLYETLVDEKS